jgi:deoxyribose-phosphate aldolase
MPAATLEAFEVMMNVIAEEYLATKKVIGIKPAGGIRTTADALSYTVKCQDILRERVSTEFAEAYLKADTFRIGASSLLDDLVASIAEDLSLSVQKSELI